MELDKEEVLNELMNFEKNYGRDCESGLPDCLERFLVNIAKSGDTIYPWNKIKPVILKKIELVINEFNTKYPYENNPVLPNVKSFNFQEMKDEIIEKFDYFYGAPFTIQRICELLTAPSTYYKRSDKFMRGLEKNIRVITTIEARRPDIENEPNSFQREFSHSPKNNSSSSPSTASSSNIHLPSLPSSSSASSLSSPSSSSAFMNGMKEDPTSPVLSLTNRMSQSCSPLQDHGPLPNSPAPLQQLDSFTTVFASPPSTPLAVVSDIHPYDAGSPSSSSSSSSESSPQPSSSSSPPPNMAPDSQELGQSFEFDENKLKEGGKTEQKSDSVASKKSIKLNLDAMDQSEPMDQVSEDKFEAQENLEEEKDLIDLDTPKSKFDLKSSPDAPTIEEFKEVIGDQVDESNAPIDSSSPKKGPEITSKRLDLDQKSPVNEVECQDTDEPSKLKESSVESFEASKSSVELIENSTHSSGQNEQSDENDELNKSGGDCQNDGNDSIKTDSTDSIENPADDPDPEQDQEPISSGSSTISEEETADNNVPVTIQQPTINEESESH